MAARRCCSHWPELAKPFWTSHPENAEKLRDRVGKDLAGGKKFIRWNWRLMLSPAGPPD
jgi:hypothetical protein